MKKHKRAFKRSKLNSDATLAKYSVEDENLIMTNYVKIAPSILSSNFSKLGEEITTLNSSECDYIHIMLWTATLYQSYNRSWSNWSLDHIQIRYLMSPYDKSSNEYLPSHKAGSDIITIHHETSDNVLIV